MSESEDKGDICNVCDRKFIIYDILKDKNAQIEAQTRHLLGKGGLNDQLETQRAQLLKIKKEGHRSK